MTTEERIAKLERQCRWYRNLFILAGLAVVALVTWGATKPVPDVIRAKRVEAVNNQGKATAVMAAFRHHGDGVFRAYNRAGVEVFYAGSSGTGDGKVEVKTKSGKIIVELSGRK